MNKRVFMIITLAVAVIVPATVVADAMINGTINISGKDTSPPFYYSAGSNYSSSGAYISWSPAITQSGTGFSIMKPSSDNLQFLGQAINGSMKVSQLSGNVYELNELVLTVSSGASKLGGYMNITILNAHSMNSAEIYFSIPDSNITMQNLSSLAHYGIQSDPSYSIYITPGGSAPITFSIGFLFPAGSYDNAYFQIASSFVS